MFRCNRKRRTSLQFESLQSREVFASDWCNPANPLDVDQSGRVVALDALLIVNEINTNGARDLGAKPASYTGPLLDTNGDGRLGAIDVLTIVNAINKYSMPISLNVSSSPTGERVILPSGSVRTNIIYEGSTVPDSTVTLEQLDTTVAPLNLTTTADENGMFHFQFDTSGAALNLKVTTTDKLGRVETKTISLPATDAPSPELVNRIESQTMPSVGDVAPIVVLKDQTGTDVDVSQYIGTKRVVLYFYPKDETPGCTTQAQDFRDHIAEFAQKNTVVIGVSLDSVASHAEFAQKHSLNFPILADPAFETAVDYGVLSEYNGAAIAKRTTFIIGYDGKIQKIFENVQVANHITEVLAALRPDMSPATT